jgi:hypothetical protein
MEIINKNTTTETVKRNVSRWEELQILIKEEITLNEIGNKIF